MNTIRRFAVAALGLFFAGSLALAQTTTTTPTTQTTGIQNLYGLAPSWNVGGSPAIAGTALYAHEVNTSGTYAFTAVDMLPNTLKPLTVTTNIGVGVAQKVATIGEVPIYVPSSAGISVNGSNTGWAWTAGALAPIKVKGDWYLLLGGRLVKSSVSGGSGYQPILSVGIGWGK